MTQDPLHIVKLEGKNVLRLKAIRVDAAGKSVRITGKNDQGKTSVLALIRMALGGKGAVPPRPLREGQESGEAVVELSDGLIVRRRFTANDSYLEVGTKDAGFKSPQAILDRLLGRDGRAPLIAFDPLEFERLPADRQRDILVRLANLEEPLAHWQNEHAETRVARTEANRRLRDAKAAPVPSYPAGTPDEPLSLDVFQAELAAIQDNRAQNDLVRQEHARALDAITHQQARVSEAERRLKELQEAVEEMSAARDDATDRLSNAKAGAKALEGKVKTLVDPNPQEVLTRMRAATVTNENVKAKAEAEKHARLVAQLAQEAEEADKLVIAQIKARDAMVAEAKMPIEGLGFSDQGITYRGFPFEQVAHSGRVDVSVAVAKALNPNLRVILMDGAEALDQETRARVIAAAEGDGYQVWWTEVASNPEGPSVHIVDGEVQGDA